RAASSGSTPRRRRSPPGSTAPRTGPTATSSASPASRTCSRGSTRSCTRPIPGSIRASADLTDVGEGVGPAVLLVDDVEENLLELETLLAAPGRRLVSAASGEAAVEALRGSDFAVVILDVRLPRMSGFEVAERMRSDAATAHVPIVFVTAIEKDPRQVFAGYELGAVDYLLRPIDPHVLRTKVGV